MRVLRPIAVQAWRYKERIVFVLLLLVLCQRVYSILSPVEQPPAPPAHVPGAGTVAVAIPSPAPSRYLRPPQTVNLVQSNPLWYWSVAARHEADKTDTAPANILDIRDTPDGAMVQLRFKGSRARWFRAGDRYGSFRVLRIDPGSRSVLLFDREQNRQLSLAL